MQDTKQRRDRPSRTGIFSNGLRAAGTIGARAVLAALVLASAWTAVTLGRVLRPRAAVG